MSLYYLDASAWVKCYVREAGSDWMRGFWDLRLPVACSSLGYIEVISAILRRAGRSDSEIGAVLGKIGRDREAIYEAGVSATVLEQAEALVRRHRLRTADAIHLASAAMMGKELEESVSVIASDAELLAAATAEGMAAIDPQANPQLPTGKPQA
ncbi:MAG TPA: type II toxin-antitoxin system VapC family toxin [Phycisphaerae bacterium]|nr:type II toxin-antitoxin system VapC family toxin [Phycisphaerae bacterium]HRR86888.1 type II toxin-antitoxin system VapC family toxin [Phycisphaerae bacterium]